MLNLRRTFKMNLVKFTENFLHMDVLCVGNYLNFTLAGIGSSLYVYDDQTLRLSKRIFIGERIHSIYVKNDMIVLKGGRELALVILAENLGEVKCQMVSKIQCSDWIQNVILLKETLVGLITAHNIFELWNLTSEKCLKVYSCEEKCILYSCKIVGDSLDNVVVLSGTAFGDVLIWAPISNGENALLKRFKGHNGAVFSVEANTTERILSTTSDDRSLRIWFVTTKEPTLHPSQWKDSKIELIHTFYGHTARVWRSLIMSNFYITIGEDSQLIVWKKDGRIGKAVPLHQESGMRAVHHSEEAMTITTGGGDGGINTLSWKFLTSETEAVEPFKCINIGQNFSTKICFVKKGFVYTINGGSVFVSNSHEEILYKSEHFQTYCLLEVSSEYIILGSIKGHLVVIDAKTKVVLTHGQYLNGRVYSIHCLGGYLLTCGPDGLLHLWKYSEGTLRTVKVMVLPNCKERWTTCGIIYNNHLVIGDRMGNLHVFDLNGGENPIRSFHKIHSYLGVTDIYNDGDVIFTVGRDGTLKTFTRNFTHSTTNKIPMEWPWKIVNFNGDILVLGFHSVSFVVWSMKHREIIESHNCGGGHRSCDFNIHENKLSFLYVKEKKVFKVDLILNEITRIRKGFHRSEINCLKIIKTNPLIVITGSEDTTLRISRIEKSEIEEIHVLKTHISSIRAISVCPMTLEKFLIASAGGKAQIVVWTFDLKTLKCHEMVNYRLREETRNWKSSTLVIDPETRFMCVDILKLENTFVVAIGCSDCQVRIFSYSEGLELLASIFYTHCILGISILTVEGRLSLVSMGTDGKVIFWDITDCSDISQLGNFSLHQSGINSFQFEKVGCGKFILATGGDDNLVSVSLVEFSQVKLSLSQLWKSSTCHSCQITGIQILNDILLTTSIDQRITVWKWSLEGSNCELKFLDQYLTSVPDVQGMDSSLDDNDAMWVSVYGKGMEILNVNVCSVNRDKDAPFVSFIIPVKGKQDKFVVGIGHSTAIMTWNGVSSTVQKKDLEILHTVEQDKANNRFNDGKCDPVGRVFAGTMGTLINGVWEVKQGKFYSFGKDRTLKCQLNDVGISNGLCWSLDGKTLYYVDSLRYCIDAFDYNPQTGDMSNRRVVFDLPSNGIDATPDGMTIDASGKLWLALYGGYGVICVNPKTQKLEAKIPIPGKYITCIQFGGDNFEDMYVTSATIETNPNELKTDSYLGGTFKITGYGVKGCDSNPAVL